MFLRNAWYVAAAREELKDRLLARTLLNEPVVLGRDRSGTLFALEDRCCHRAAPLSLGWIAERGLICGYHGLAYDATGACVSIPGHKGKIPKEARVRSYPVTECGDFVWIWMGDPVRADKRQVIDYPPDDPINWPRSHGMLHVKASYVLLLENLMDLSHLSYLQRSSIGSSPEDSADAKIEVKSTPTGAKFLRLMLTATPAKATVLRQGFTGQVDRWSDFEFVAPSCVVQWSGAVSAGLYQKGVREGGQSNRILHAVTPETDRTCHYFFCAADGYARFEASGARKAMEVSEIFKEDALMVEQQQLRLEGYDAGKLLNIPSDVARVKMARFLKQKIQEEQAQVTVAAE